MKQAILITAYHQIDLLRTIISFFDDDFDFYIHIDKKCKENWSDLKNNPHVYICSKYKIFWGSEYHLFAIMDLIKESYKRGPYSYYHLITGSDYPIKSLSEFKSFFSVNNKTNYIEYYRLPRASWPNEGGVGRIRYYWIGNQWRDIRSHHKILDFLLKIQRKLHIKRCFCRQFKVLYGGGTYWSLTQDAIACLVNNSQFAKYMKWTHCAEEVFFHTILLCNINEASFESNSKRYMVWGNADKSPAILSTSDYDDIQASDAFFARKMDAQKSCDLIKKIRNEFS